MTDWGRAARQAREKDYPHHDSLALGSWTARICSDRRKYIDFLRAHFRQEAVARNTGQGGAQIRLVHCDPGHPLFADNCEIPEDTLSVRLLDKRRIGVTTPLLRAIAARGPRREEITMFLLGGIADDCVLTTHFSVAFRRVLLECGLFYLHAGAVERNGSVSLFIGEKGAGKSTVCLRLAQEGAGLLSDDHVLVRRRRGRYLVSGSDRIARITSDTERFLFSEPLGIEARDFAGTAKKEVATSELFRCSPFKDYSIQNVFFPRVGREFSIRSIPEAAAAVRLLAGNKHGLRFAERKDYDSFLDFFSGMVAGRRSFDLELSPDPADLSQLLGFLENG